MKCRVFLFKEKKSRDGRRRGEGGRGGKTELQRCSRTSRRLDSNRRMKSGEGAEPEEPDRAAAAAGP